MDRPGSDTAFAGSIPELYDSHLVPPIFEPYAADLASRVEALDPSRALETAAGTGVATRAMARALPAHVDLVATDLNQPMPDRAAAVGTQRPVRRQQADATRLPFDDASFDIVVCQFSVMFFPDKGRAFYGAHTPHGYFDREAISRDLANAGSARRHASRRLQRVVERRRRAYRPSPTARERPCATRVSVVAASKKHRAPSTSETT